MIKHNWAKLDVQMQKFSSFLRDELGLDAAQSNQLATTISQEITGASAETIELLKGFSLVPLRKRMDELVAFQDWMDAASQIHSPSIRRAQVMTQNYVCFVYLGESCFGILKKHLPSGSTTRKVCQFLTDNPIRAFRNAIAHGNWNYSEDFSAIEFWARKGSDVTEPMVKWEVHQRALSFWQALARTVAYVTFTSLLEE